ncbi:hypothetical protein ACFQ08_41670, partial [Streptosporangium algeriense]
RWWAESVRPLVPAGAAALLDEVFRYDLLTQPVYRPEESGERLPVVRVNDEEYYVRAAVELAYDVPTIVTRLRKDLPVDLTPAPRTVDLYYRTGSDSAVTSTNHEIVMHFMGLTKQEVEAGGRVGSTVAPEAGGSGTEESGAAEPEAAEAAEESGWGDGVRSPLRIVRLKPEA